MQQASKCTLNSFCLWSPSFSQTYPKYVERLFTFPTCPFPSTVSSSLAVTVPSQKATTVKAKRSMEAVHSIPFAELDVLTTPAYKQQLSTQVDLDASLPPITLYLNSPLRADSKSPTPPPWVRELFDL